MATFPPRSRTKPEFWRIRGIDIGEREAAREWLKEQVGAIVISEGQGFSLVADVDRTLCATLASFERPSPPNRSWHVDKDFTGFTPLNDPEDAAVDVVAITGLGGHALGSFRSADGTCVWLRDFAPRDIPHARFVTYGYDSAVAESNCNQGIWELARTFLDGLATFRRRTSRTTCPLCFVCHSLGGVVLKEALVIAGKAVEATHGDLRQIMKATHGLLLMGVPNLGLRHDQLSTVVKGRPNQGFINDLLVRPDGEPSHFLKYLAGEFANLDSRRQTPFEIVSYYETITSPTAVPSHGGKVVMKGPKVLMVTQTSAERVGHLSRAIDHLPSHTDHRGLVRFEHSQDERYRSIADKLEKMTSNAASRADLPVQALIGEATQQSITRSGANSE